MQKRNQLFIISRAVRESLSVEEVEATVVGLKELGLWALPYPTVDLWVSTDGFACTVLDDFTLGAETYSPAKQKNTIRDWVREGIMRTIESASNGAERVTTNFGEGAWVEYRNLSLEDHIQCERTLHFEGNKHFPNQRLILGVAEKTLADQDERLAMANMLIVLLATRNATKEIEHRKCIGLGIGAKRKTGRKSYEYVTTLHIPAEAELPTKEGEGAPNGSTKAPHLRRGHIRRQHFGPANEFVKRIWIQPVFVNADKDWVSTRRAYNMGI